MTTITRRQLQDAIEAGITAVETDQGFTVDEANALRHVGAEASLVARGSYVVRSSTGGKVRCPVGQAIPNWADLEITWNLAFARVFDRATWEAIGRPVGAQVMQVTEDDNEVEAA